MFACMNCNIMKSGFIPLEMVRFSIRNHRWKAEDLSYLKICEYELPMAIIPEILMSRIFHVLQYCKVPFKPTLALVHSAVSSSFCYT